MRSSRTLAVCYNRAVCTTTVSGAMSGRVPLRSLHSHAVLRSLRKKVVPSLDVTSSDSSSTATASSSPAQPSPTSNATAPTAAHPAAASSNRSAGPSPSHSSSSLSTGSTPSRPSARSASLATSSSFFRSPSTRSSSVSTSSSSRPSHRRADSVTSFRRHDDGQGLIRHARKRDDDCNDTSYNWRMGLIVERLPTVLNPPPAWEVEWEQHMRRKEARTAVPIPDALKPQDDPVFDPTPIDTNTADDAADHRLSLNRRARDSLYLLVRKENGHTGESTWTFPSVRYTALPYASITPKQAASSSIRHSAGDSVNVHTLSNAPVAYHRYEYSEQYRSKANTQQRGGKLFLFHALYLNGSVDLSEQRTSLDSRSRYTDYVWVPRSQLHEYVNDQELLNLAIDVLITDADYADETDVQHLERQQRDRQQNIVYPPQQQQQQQHSNSEHSQEGAGNSSTTSTATAQHRQPKRLQHTQ